MTGDNEKEVIPLWTESDDSCRPSTAVPLLQKYHRLFDPESISDELWRIVQVQEGENRQWNSESERYEQTLPGTNHQPRRNYFNPAGIVKDKSMFPYDDHFYALIDSYDSLYHEGEGHHHQQLQPMEVLSPRPLSEPVHLRRRGEQWENLSGGHWENFRGLHNDENDERDQLLASSQAIHQSFFSTYDGVLLRQSFNWFHAVEYEAVKEESGPISTFKQLSTLFEKGQTREEVNGSAIGDEDRQEARTLLRIVRHAMSELQRDYFLASCAIVRIAQQGDLDNVDVLRRLLIIFDAEFVLCDFPCLEEYDDHMCCEWGELLATFGAAISHSISFLTQDHALAIAGFVTSKYLREFGDTAKSEDAHGVQSKRRILLKQAVAVRRAMQEEDTEHRDRSGKEVPEKLVTCIVRSLGKRAYLERIRCEAVVTRDAVSELTMRKCLDSYWNCVRALVEIGENTIESLPDSERFYDIASAIVRSLAYCMISGLEYGCSILPDRFEYIRPAQLPSLIDPLRYAETVTNSTAKVHRERDIKASESINGVRGAIARVLQQMERPEDVKDVVRCLFVSDMVDIRMSGLGYGDFVVWAGYECDAHDPALFWSIFNLPQTVDESESEDELSEMCDRWEKDESGFLLHHNTLHVRYAYTAVCLCRAWINPWSPESHMSFQKDLREAITTVALCSDRLTIPNDVVLHVGSFLNRHWWPDNRRQCWSYECCLESLRSTIQRKRGALVRSAKQVKFTPCNGCGLAWYCSAACQKDDIKTGHKRVCGIVPWMVRCNSKECELHRSVFKGSVPHYLVTVNTVQGILQQPSSSPGEDYIELADEDGRSEDDGSWESIDSGAEDASERFSVSSTTNAIGQFFDHMMAEKNYKRLL